METKLLFHFRGIFANLTCAQFLKGIEKHRTDEGLTLETSAFHLFKVANLPYQLS